MARAASAVPHQPDSTNPTHLPVLTSTPPLCLFLLYYLITLCIHLSTAPRLHSLRHPTGRLRPFRRYANTTWHCPISSPVRSHPVPHVNQGRASRPEVDERAARFTKLMHTTSATVQHISFLARRRQPDCKTNCFSIAGFDCLFLFD